LKGDIALSDRPNIIFLIADDHRGDAIHAFGNPEVQTPVLDGLAERGVSFRRAYTMGGMSPAVCVPSRAALLTGTNPLRASIHPVPGDGPGSLTINPALATLPEVLRAAGYHTYGVGKWHNDKASFTRGFAGGSRLFFGGMSDQWRVPTFDYDPTGQYPVEARQIREQFSSALFADAGIQFLRDFQGDAPYFLYVAFTAPHDPRTAPPEFAALYDPQRITLPPNFLPEHPFDNGEMRVRDELLAPFPRTPAVIRQHIADYYAMISSLDAQIGRILAALAERGDAGHTIVVYTADHGLAVGQHGLLGKQNLYEHSIRVPRIMAGPGLPAGNTVRALTHHADGFPTLCALAGIPVPSTVEGRSLLPLLTNNDAPWRDSVFAMYKDVQRAVSDGDWKLIRYYRSGDPAVGSNRTQLFHLKDDPWEMHDLSSDPTQKEHLRRLAEEMAAWQRRTGDFLALRSSDPSPSVS
jgi:arylsulfatase A-like enzyme